MKTVYKVTKEGDLFVVIQQREREAKMTRHSTLEEAEKYIMQQTKIENACSQVRQITQELLDSMSDMEDEVVLPLVNEIINTGSTHCFFRGVNSGREDNK